MSKTIDQILSDSSLSVLEKRRQLTQLSLDCGAAIHQIVQTDILKNSHKTFIGGATKYNVCYCRFCAEESEYEAPEHFIDFEQRFYLGEGHDDNECDNCGVSLKKLYLLHEES